MGAIRTCCGYFCAFIAVIAIPFFILCIAMEGTKNQFMMFKLNTPYTKINNPVGEGEQPTDGFYPNNDKRFITYDVVNNWADDGLNLRMININKIFL